MPCSDDPHVFAHGIVAILDDEGDQPSLHKADDAILLWIITALVFDVGETQQLVEQSQVNVTSPQDFLSFCVSPIVCA